MPASKAPGANLQAAAANRALGPWPQRSAGPNM